MPGAGGGFDIAGRENEEHTADAERPDNSRALTTDKGDAVQRSIQRRGSGVYGQSVLHRGSDNNRTTHGLQHGVQQHHHGGFAFHHQNAAARAWLAHHHVLGAG